MIFDSVAADLIMVVCNCHHAPASAVFSLMHPLSSVVTIRFVINDDDDAQLTSDT